MSITSLSSKMGRTGMQKQIWSLFFRLFIIFLYLLLGTGLLCILVNSNNESHNDVFFKIMDSERRELLNVLWSESLAQSEHSWSIIANQKLDNYEKALKTAIVSQYGIDVNNKKGLANKANGALTLIMTLNDFGEPYDMFIAYICLILYIFGGVVLFHIYLEKFVEIINELSFSCFKISCLFIIITFCYTIIHEFIVIEDEGKPFFKNFLNAFYIITTISKNQQDQNSLILVIFQIGGTSLFFSLILTTSKVFITAIKYYEENLEIFEESFYYILSIPYKFYDFIQKFVMYFLQENDYKQKIIENDDNNILKNHNLTSNNILIGGANSTLSSSRKSSLRLSQKPYDSLHEEEEEEEE
ncbi:Hypothetical protein SRAE_X000038900 [Strongyloides ratti]|uniref:Uncharacterized protein n=1 Tax=Strongyloides ratti TaxID=34506 RepID=A0A090LS72_STRRB|nr:Hypothetical protein SRAE_X000038900 [Strongyloides ratti]CEF71062.1 Hypothetical protein SRAE_X000038900 [Strongyloides ratti]